MATTKLPPVKKRATPADHVVMSERFLDHAQEELDKDSRLQASEKVWGAVTHALKAIAEKRGWQHSSHESSNLIVEQLGREFNRSQQFEAWFDNVEMMHLNFYKNNRYPDRIQRSINNAEKFVAELDRIRNEMPQEVEVKNKAEQQRLGRLLGISKKRLDRVIPVGSVHEFGFSLHPPGGGTLEDHITRPPTNNSQSGSRDDNNPPDGEGTGGMPVTRGKPPSSPPGSGPRRRKLPTPTQPSNPALALGQLQVTDKAKSRNKNRQTASDGPPAELAHLPPHHRRSRPKGIRKPKPVFPKVGTGRGKATRAARPPGFKPPRLPGMRRQ